MKDIQLNENNDLLIEISKKDYISIDDKEKTYIRYANDNPNDFHYYYKKITDENEKNFLLNYGIYETLIKIKNIGLFFVILTIINIIASILLALR